MNKNRATVFAHRLLQNYDVELEVGAGGRFMGTHRIMARPRRKALGNLMRCHAYGDDWREAIVQLASKLSEDPDAYTASVAAEILEDFTSDKPVVLQEAQNFLRPIGRDRFLAPDDA